MWILDSSLRKDEVVLWGPGGAIERVRAPSSFLFNLPDLPSHWEMVDGLTETFPVSEVTIQTIYGPLKGFQINAGVSVAEMIAVQTQYSARLFNVDLRRDLRYLAEHRHSPCRGRGIDRFSATVDQDLVTMEIAIKGDPLQKRAITDCTVICDHQRSRFSGDEQTVLADLFGLIEAVDPDLLLFPNADIWMERVIAAAGRHGIRQTISRTERFATLDSRSYWSYGRMYHRPKAMLPEGRVLIDTAQSFIYKEAGLEGILIAARLTGLPPNRTARCTPGTLISTYEVYEALTRGIAVPWQKTDADRVKSMGSLRAVDRGGMMFQPEPGVYGRTYQIDFTSLYPAIIVKHNLSPETVEHPELQGFLATVLDPLLSMRIATKEQKRCDPTVTGVDAMLKWMLVTCFGYTGYRNAKFGRVDVHERITGISREVLIETKAIAEQLGFTVLHGIVDCLWVQGEPIRALKLAVEEETGFRTEVETYDWLVFLQQKDGSGAYNRYYGRLDDGSVKVRGIMMRRGDCPRYVAQMQQAVLGVMKKARSVLDLQALTGEAEGVYEQYRSGLAHTKIADLLISRRISTVTYSRRCPEAGAVAGYRRAGVQVAPGMTLQYVVRDAKKGLADPVWEAREMDHAYYISLLEKAWSELLPAIKPEQKIQGILLL
ncbi:type B DNA-directed DNA polymerase [Methanosphaerula palustris]|uniref:DNA-directed DNA polymerase n=1 Tax=Methanosphaerula palustris (strain ATCC BAA-1556 / DSM 19958 / E1-9c) TaxID=521011 RepID=B8GHC0_METPE|nr:type B DNA-directed DNA polymerase [Methanosphaerula palustris]ACL16525.1 DNA polymerase B region [Methanosphaerula palustris E1-9c]